jgi:23S rRNA (cytidine1920-2'-O)/16S rRNA (cytidine1409-2'-O)-methyltransferase
VDKLVVERGLAPTREKAQRMILAGDVLVDDSPVDKPGTFVPEDAELRLRTKPKPFVGRGGEKLEGALDALGLDVSGLRALDVGASTGGFTDCLLQRSAAHVTALDVGKGQLDWKLYSDPRVRVVEETNARHLKPGDFPDLFDLVTADVSFISLTKVLPALAPLVKTGGRLLLLVKPQFELSPSEVERGGLVRDPERHWKAVESVAGAVAKEGFHVLDVVRSSVPGATGNVEFFLLAGRGPERAKDDWVPKAREACAWEER